MQATAIQVFFAQCPWCDSQECTQLASFPELRFAKCSACGLIYKTHEDSQLRQKLTRDYDEGYFRSGRAQYMKRWAHRVAKCQRQLRSCMQFISRPKRLLDVGCSAGYVLEAAKHLNLEPVGLDISSFAVELVKEKGYQAVVGGMESLPFPDASFDVITAKHTFEHVDAPKVALKEVFRALSPGGVAMFVVPDALYWKAQVLPNTGRYFVPSELGWQHHVYYSVETLSRALKQAGFEVCATNKAVYRKDAVGFGKIFEPLRFLGLWLLVTAAAVLRLPHEIQLIARKPT